MESTLIFGLLFGLIWLAWDLCWVLFAASSLQLAVSAGARAAVVGQLQYGASDMKNTIDKVAEHAAPAFLTHSLACQALHIDLYDQNGNPTTTPTDLGVVRVSIQNYPFKLLTPIFAIANGTKVSPAGSAAAQIMVSASSVSQACDPLNCIKFDDGTWPPSPCL